MENKPMKSLMIRILLNITAYHKQIKPENVKEMTVPQMLALCHPEKREEFQKEFNKLKNYLNDKSKN